MALACAAKSSDLERYERITGAFQVRKQVVEREELFVVTRILFRSLRLLRAAKPRVMSSKTPRREGRVGAVFWEQVRECGLEGALSECIKARAEETREGENGHRLLRSRLNARYEVLSCLILLKDLDGLLLSSTTLEEELYIICM